MLTVNKNSILTVAAVGTLSDIGLLAITDANEKRKPGVVPMNYTLQVRVAGTSNVVLAVPNVNLNADKYYTVYAIGLVGENPELNALLLLDGENSVK